MARTRNGLIVLAVTSALALAVWMGALERSGPARFNVGIGYGIPATLYVPGDRVDGRFPDPPSADERPPAVVIAHGFTADRLVMSSVARSLARNGYTALTFDFRGHGANQRSFPGDLNADLRAVVDWLSASPYADPDRIVVLGHSMGAGAAVEFASIDPRPIGVVAVSGGRRVAGERTPPNVLLLVASGDPGDIHRSMDALATDLAHQDAAVRSAVIDGTDHVTILWSARTVEETVDWLAAITGEPAQASVRTGDPRLRLAALYVLLVLVLVGAAGVLTGRLAPAQVQDGGRGAGGGLVVMIVALGVAMPFMAFGPPAAFLPLAIGDVVVSLFAVAGVVALGARALARRGILFSSPAAWLAADRRLGVDLRGLVFPVAAGVGAVYLLFLPLEPVFHRLVPTPARLGVGAIAALLLLPFFVAFEALLRRGGPVVSTLWGVAGRVVVLAAVVLGTQLGFVPGVVMLLVPILVLLFVAFEIFAAAAYATGRNVVVIAAVQSIWLGWLVATTNPILI